MCQSSEYSVRFCQTLVPPSKLRDMPFQNIALLVFVSVLAGHLAVFMSVLWGVSQSQWPRGRRRRSAAARLTGLRVRLPPGAGMCVCCECCVLWGRGVCGGSITRPEESYRMWCFWARSRNLIEQAALGCRAMRIKLWFFIVQMRWHDLNKTEHWEYGTWTMRIIYIIVYGRAWRDVVVRTE